MRCGKVRSGRLEMTVLPGELALDGRVRPVRGVLPAEIAAKRSGEPPGGELEPVEFATASPANRTARFFPVELLRRYSKLDTFQRSVLILAKSLVRSDAGTFRAPSPRYQATPPEPFKVSQRVGPDLIAQIIARYEAGEPSTALAAAFRISKGSVIRLLREADIAIRKQGLSRGQVGEAIRLYESGQSLAKIGTQFGVDPTTVHRQLLKRGVRMRGTRGTHGRER